MTVAKTAQTAGERDSQFSRAAKDQKEIDEQSARELKELAECLMDIRRRTGWGRIVVELKAGEIVEMEISFKRRPKTEKRNRE
ncbi:MAG: hypothetical protein PHQ36_01790 [Anaerolineales bacterium]|nr:hypothetical protein [Anaerolineales bacterium]